MNEKRFAEAVRAVMTRPAKGKLQPPTKRDLKRRFKLKIARGKPQMVEISETRATTLFGNLNT